MSNVLQYLLDNAMVVVVIVLLAVIAFRLSRRPEIHLTVDVDNQIARLNQAVVHHVQISAVVEMITQLDEMDDDAVERLKTYPDRVQAAAWLYRINCLGADLKVAQDDLSHCLQVYGLSSSVTSAAQKKVDDLAAKLAAAVIAARRSGMRAV